MPAFDVTLGVRDGSFRYASLPQGVTGINVDAAVSNPGGTLDATKVDVDRFTLTFAGNTLGATLHAATPLSDLRFSATADGRVDLGAVKDVYPLGDSVKLGGKVTVDLRAAARMSDIEAERFEKVDAEGSFAVEDMTADVAGLPEVRIRRAAASITPQAMTLSELGVALGASDLAAHGRLTNYLAYALRGETLKGSLTVTSSLLDLNEIMGVVPAGDDSAAQEPASESAESAEPVSLAVPKNLDLSLSTTLGRVLFQKMEISDFVGSLRVRNGILSVDRLSMGIFGGSFSSQNAVYDTSNPDVPTLRLSCALKNASFSQTFRQLDMIKNIVPLFEKTGGDYSMSLDMSTRMSPDLTPDIMSLNAKGEISSQNIRLQNVEAFDKLADALKNDKLRTIEARDVKISFTVADGRVTTRPFDLRMGGVDLNLSGSTGLDSTIDYTGKVSLP
ncbi:MAG: AsmA family protein, partial [Alistipes sp.]|nr:AsmA family protein [Alistipes sp.]